MILRHETAISVAVGLLVLVLWVLTDGNTSWPRWVWYGLAIPLALQAAIAAGCAPDASIATCMTARRPGLCRWR